MTATSPDAGAERTGRGWLLALPVLIACVVLARVLGRALHLGDLWVALCFPAFVFVMARTRGWGLWSSVVPLIAVTAVYVLGL